MPNQLETLKLLTLCLISLMQLEASNLEAIVPQTFQLKET